MVVDDDPELDRLRDLCYKLSAGEPPSAELSRWLVNDPDWLNIHVAMRLMAERIIARATGANAPYSALATYCAGLYPAVRSYIECGWEEFQYRVDCIAKLDPPVPVHLADESRSDKNRGEAGCAVGIFFYGVDPTNDEQWLEFVDLVRQVKELDGNAEG